MGVTVHYEGCLRTPLELEEMIKTVVRYAEGCCWFHRRIDGDATNLLRIIDEKECYYSGPVFGVELRPHTDAEPLKFEFDDEMFLQDFCKTQFAGAETHIAVIELLDKVEHYFVELRVEDEGEYWSSRDEARLHGHLDTVNQMLKDIKDRIPDAEGPIYTESSRIMDAWSGDEEKAEEAASLAKKLLAQIRNKLLKY
jgi:hypothetical protein